MKIFQIVKKIGLISCVLLASLIVSSAYAYPVYGSVAVGGIQVSSYGGYHGGYNGGYYHGGYNGGYYHGGYNNGYYGGGYHHWNNYHYQYHYNNYYH